MFVQSNSQILHRGNRNLSIVCLIPYTMTKMSTTLRFAHESCTDFLSLSHLQQPNEPIYPYSRFIDDKMKDLKQ